MRQLSYNGRKLQKNERVSPWMSRCRHHAVVTFDGLLRLDASNSVLIQSPWVTLRQGCITAHMRSAFESARGQ